MIAGTVRYHLDVLTVSSLAATLLDIGTTCWFLAAKAGTEANPVLAPLAARSLLWVPVYLGGRNLLIPAMARIYREPFALGFLLSGLLCGINNLTGILAGSFFLVKAIGILALGAVAVVPALVWFAIHLARTTGKWRALGGTVAWVGLFGLVEGAFYLLGLWL
jgi:hypothetical protein